MCHRFLGVLTTALAFCCQAAAADSVTSSNGSGTEEVRQAQRHVQNELTECGIYYTIVIKALLHGGEKQTADKYFVLGKEMYDRALELGTSIGMTSEEMGARKKRALIDQGKMVQVDQSGSNGDRVLTLSKLTNKYSDFCKALRIDSDFRFEYHLLKEQQKSGNENGSLE